MPVASDAVYFDAGSAGSATVDVAFAGTVGSLTGPRSDSHDGRGAFLGVLIVGSVALRNGFDGPLRFARVAVHLRKKLVQLVKMDTGPPAAFSGVPVFVGPWALHRNGAHVLLGLVADVLPGIAEVLMGITNFFG